MSKSTYNSRIIFRNINTGKESSLWDVPMDVAKYLRTLTKVEIGYLFDKWKREHNFNEFIRYRIKQTNFKI